MANDFDPYHRWLGIAPDQRPPDHYQLLGIPRFESDVEVIAGAADRQMAHVRSFQSGKHVGATQRLLNELAAARVCLLSPEQKAKYDTQLRAATGPAFSLRAEPPIAVRATPQSRRSSRQPRPNTFIWIGMIAGIITGIGATVLAVFLLSPRHGQLTVELSPADRAQATLEIDGIKQPVPTKGVLEFPLTRGPHKVVVKRPVHARFERTVEITPGQATLLKVALRPLARLTIEITGRRPENLKLFVDGEPQTMPANRLLVIPCEPGMHVIRADSPRGKFEKTVTVLPEQNFLVPVAILADSRLIGKWNGTVEIDQPAVQRRLDQAQSNPLLRAFVEQSLEVLRIGQLDIAVRDDGTYDLTMKIGPLTNSSSGRWAVTEEKGSRLTVELTPQQGPVEFRQFHFDGKDAFRTDLPKDLSGLGQFHCRRAKS